MKVYQEFFIIIFFSILGEGTRIVAHLPIPGSILGILYLFLAFQLHIVDPDKLGTTGQFLLNNLTILFVPAGVGLLDYFDQIMAIWPILLGAVVCCSIVTMVVTGKTAEGVEALVTLLRTRKKTRIEGMEESPLE
ncbi:holin-like protein [Enterococcus sp. 10A9_DIV0425]|uniref:Holin-like protein n=2 Tax=Candidatus Enterococcus wittei TaxID=1987383 RepID=A0A242K1J0_9ENTE|nr:CidA/LrgA family protein [Enterococcus sp. 10A9_DIV0425]OTP10916.1 holin-like protein [Enterococcus sp. 10A9_DIV0425]THE09766.1 CidA/LrgA family protein [Enterococcus hirae]